MGDGATVHFAIFLNMGPPLFSTPTPNLKNPSPQPAPSASPPQPPQQSGRDPRGDLHNPVHLHFGHHLRIAMQRGEQPTLPDGHADERDRAERLGGAPQHGTQTFHATRGMRSSGWEQRRRQDRMGVSLAN